MPNTVPEARSPLLAPNARSLAALNVVGGTLVLGSYVWGLSAVSGDALWGGVPEALRPLYTLNMFLAAAGYFLFTPYILLRVVPAASREPGKRGPGFFRACYALVLIPSALWLPLTALHLEQVASWSWALVRLDLALVALGSLGLLMGLLGLGSEAPRGRALAIAGLAPFLLQTVVLDAIVWPALHP